MKKILAVVLAMVMCASLFAGCGGSNIAAKTTDMKTLLQNTAKQLVKESENATKSLYGFMPDEEEGYGEISVGADNIYLPVDDSFTLTSFMANIGASTSMKDGEMALVFDGAVNGVEVDLLEMLWSDELISLTSPSLMDKTFTLPTVDFTTKWNNSLLGSMSPITEEIPSLAFSDYMEISTLSEDMVKEMLDLTTDFLVNANTANEETVIALNGADTTVTKFTMVVTKDTLKTYLLALTDSFLKLMENDMYKQSLISSMGISEYEYEDAIAQVKSELEGELDNMEFEDVTFYVYGYDAKIVRVEWSGEIDGETGTIYLQFNNPDYLLDDIDMVVESSDDYGTYRGVVSMDSNLGSSKGDLFVNFKVEMDENGTVTEMMNAEVNFNYSVGDYVIAAEIEEEDVAIEITGACKKGDMLELTIDDIVVTNSYSTVSVQSLIKEYLGTGLDITIKVSPKAEDIDLTQTSEVVDILAITEDDLTNMQTEIMNNVMKLATDLGISLY